MGDAGSPVRAEERARRQLEALGHQYDDIAGAVAKLDGGRRHHYAPALQRLTEERSHLIAALDSLGSDPGTVTDLLAREAERRCDRLQAEAAFVAAEVARPTGLRHLLRGALNRLLRLARTAFRKLVKLLEALAGASGRRERGASLPEPVDARRHRNRLR